MLGPHGTSFLQEDQMRVQEQQKAGFFWVQSAPEKKLPGTLRISDGGNILLEVLGNFDADVTNFQTSMEVDYILGHIEDNKLVTLEKCFYKNKQLALPGFISKSTLYVNKLLIGAHFFSADQIVFNTLRFSVEGLDEWLGTSGIKVDRQFQSKSASITYAPPEDIKFNITNGFKLAFVFRWTLPGFPTIREAKITQKAYIELSSDSPKPLNDFTYIAHQITNLLCFAMDTTVTVDSATATAQDLKIKIDKDKEIPAPIDIYYPSIPFSKTPPKVNLHSMLFRYSDVSSNISDIFNHWFNAYEIINPFFNLYFSVKTEEHKYLNTTFLSLVQGLETYHRRTSNETVMDEDVFNELLCFMLINCPEEHRDWLKGRLTHGNEINLGRRLKRIIDPFQNLIGNSSYRRKLIRIIVDTRNYFTHYSEDNKDNAASGRDLWKLCLVMESIFQLIFLKTLDFTEDQISSAISNCQNLSYKLGNTKL